MPQPRHPPCRSHGTITSEELTSEMEPTPHTSKTSSSLCVSPQGKTQKRTKTMETHGRRIRQSWQPSEQNLAFAAEHGFEGIAAQEAADEFRDYHLSKGDKSASWDRSWQIWIRKRADLVASRRSKPSGTEIAKNAAAIAVADRLRYDTDEIDIARDAAAIAVARRLRRSQDQANHFEADEAPSGNVSAFAENEHWEDEPAVTALFRSENQHGETTSHRKQVATDVMADFMANKEASNA